MTCIAGIVDKKGRIWVGGDSAGTNSSGQVVIHKNKKVFVRGEFLFGCTSSFRMIDLLECVLVLPDYEEGNDIRHYMVSKFVKAVRECFTQEGFLTKDDDGQEKGGKFLVGFRGRLFCIEADFQVGESLVGYMGVGCGDDIALGSLYSTQSMDMSPEDRIRLALEAATEYNTYVRPPFIIESV